MNYELYERLHSVIVAGRSMVDDKTASIAPELFDQLEQVDPNSGEEIPLVKAGTRINWNGTLKRAAVDLWDTPENNPDNTPTLWEDSQYRGGYRIIPENITAGLSFAKDEIGWWGDVRYKSTIDSNVWTPEQYPDGWEVYDDPV